MNIEPFKMLQRLKRAGGLIKTRWATRHVRTYCMFIGYERSGHSLVGSLLDAHPNALIAHEEDVLRTIGRMASRSELFLKLIDNSSRFTAEGREWTGYSYYVPDSHHGSWTRLEVIGDKKGGESSLRVRQQPQLIDQLLSVVGKLNFKIVHVTRCPYDNIATISRRRSCSLSEACNRYIEMCEGVQVARAKMPESFHDMRLEDLVADPERALSGLCGHLGIDPAPEWLKQCSDLVFDKPRRTREGVAWDRQTRERIRGTIQQYPFLGSYLDEADVDEALPS